MVSWPSPILSKLLNKPHPETLTISFWPHFMLSPHPSATHLSTLFVETKSSIGPRNLMHHGPRYDSFGRPDGWIDNHSMTMPYIHMARPRGESVIPTANFNGRVCWICPYAPKLSRKPVYETYDIVLILTGFLLLIPL